MRQEPITPKRGARQSREGRHPERAAGGLGQSGMVGGLAIVSFLIAALRGRQGQEDGVSSSVGSGKEPAL